MESKLRNIIKEEVRKLLEVDGEYENMKSYKDMKKKMDSVVSYVKQKLGKPTIEADWSDKPFLRKKGSWINKKMYWKDKFPTVNFMVIDGDYDEGFITINVFTREKDSDYKKVGNTYPILNKSDLDKVIRFVKVYNKQ